MLVNFLNMQVKVSIFVSCVLFTIIRHTGDRGRVRGCNVNIGKDIIYH